MKSSYDKNRRAFLKAASVSAAGIAFAYAAPSQSPNTAASAWTPGMKINPAIDNLRVVCCHDPRMVSGDPKSWNMQGQNAPVVPEAVYAAMDEMAKSLAQKSNAQEAWQTIFRKPSAKEWREVRAAIKVNCISENHPRVAIVAKICAALNVRGIPYQNIVIYDSDDDASKFYPEFIGAGLPEGVVVSRLSDALGGMVPVTTPEPYPGTFKCTKALVTGEIDILVNIAVNKGHKAAYGETTLTLKNHAGTFEPKPIHIGGGLDYIIAMNKSRPILGGDPVRQQLCIVDSLWAMTKGPFGVPDKRVDRLIMGTFGPSVDYLTAKKIREPVMGVSHQNLHRFMEDFGYPDYRKLELIEVQPPA